MKLIKVKKVKQKLPVKFSLQIHWQSSELVPLRASAAMLQTPLFKQQRGLGPSAQHALPSHSNGLASHSNGLASHSKLKPFTLRHSLDSGQESGRQESAAK